MGQPVVRDLYGAKGTLDGNDIVAGDALATGESGTAVIVIGRSVDVRRVTHGTPRYVVSSWMPPESLATTRAAAMRPTNSR